jgi:hypothetical protein
VKYFNDLLRLQTETKLWQGGNGYSKSAFINIESGFPYGFFGGLIATISFCLLSWTTYAKHQQTLAITDCIETEMISTESTESTESTAPSDIPPQSVYQSVMNRVEGETQVIPEERLERANDICEMKCIRGSLSGCQ